MGIGGSRTAKEVKKNRKKTSFTVEAASLLKDDMFMSVADFQKRRVILPFLEDDEYYDEEDDEDTDDDEEDDDGEDTEGEEDEEEEDERTDNKIGFKMTKEIEKDPGFCGRECYIFNLNFARDKNDKCCVHCRKFLTIQCPYLDEFMDEVDGLDPD